VEETDKQPLQELFQTDTVRVKGQKFNLTLVPIERARTALFIGPD
jgi:hypothetical protein